MMTELSHVYGGELLFYFISLSLAHQKLQKMAMTLHYSDGDR
jgi:hypothetical protein